MKDTPEDWERINEIRKAMDAPPPAVTKAKPRRGERQDQPKRVKVSNSPAILARDVRPLWNADSGTGQIVSDAEMVRLFRGRRFDDVESLKGDAGYGGLLPRKGESRSLTGGMFDVY